MRSPGASPAAPTRRGVDIIQNCEVTGIRREGDRVVGVETGKGFIAAEKVAVVAAGHTSVVMAMAGLRMPLESTVLQALVSEPVKPVLPVRGHVQHDPRLYQPVRQGRAGDRRRLRPVQLLQPARQLPDRRAHAGGDHASCSRSSRACACCATGAASSTSPPTARRSSARRRCRGSTSIAAGAPAASRRRRARATCSPRPWRKDEPHPINAPFSLDRFTDRPPDRRGGRRRRRALRTQPHAAGPLPLLRAAARDRVPLRRRGAHPRPDPATASDEEWARISLLPHEPEGPAPRALVPPPRLRPLVQRRARHGDRAVPRPASERRAGASSHERASPAGGRIDRGRPLALHASTAAAIEGFAGDTLASALLANGVHLVGRSFKYHRPRGIMTAGAEEPNALIQLERPAGAAIPTCAPPRSSSTTA